MASALKQVRLHAQPGVVATGRAPVHFQWAAHRTTCRADVTAACCSRQAVKSAQSRPVARWPFNHGPLNRAHNAVCPREVAVRAALAEAEGTIEREANTIRRVGWISFWSQLALAVVSSVVIFFTFTTSSTPQGGSPPLSIFFSSFGVVTSFISTFLAYSLTRTARKVLEAGHSVSKASVAGSLLAAVRLNLWGLGATLLGLQASVGTLVGKTLLTSTSNPYAAGGSAARLQNTPAALDVFGIQASTNTLLAHFVSIVFANWLQNLLLKRTAPASEKGSFFGFGGGKGKAVEPDYTARGRKGPTGAAY